MRTATTPLIGRDEEIALLLRRWEQAKAGEGSAVLISGEAGIGKSRLATYTDAHYDTHVTLACSDKGIVNCAEVTTSAQSMVFGVFPVAVLGLAFYVFMTALNSPWVWRLQQTGSEQLRKILRYTRVGAIVTGMGFVLYLVYAELIQIRAICLWCTSVHVATFLIFALIVFYTSFSSPAQVSAKRG